jgi:hypothetical protein
LSARILLSGCEDPSFERAATFARTSTAFRCRPTRWSPSQAVVAIGLNDSSADEHCSRCLQSLLPISRMTAVLVARLLGAKHGGSRLRLAGLKPDRWVIVLVEMAFIVARVLIGPEATERSVLAGARRGARPRTWEALSNDQSVTPNWNTHRSCGR